MLTREDVEKMPWIGEQRASVNEIIDALERYKKTLDAEIHAADRLRDGEISDHPQTRFDGRALGDALRRVREAVR